MAELNKYRVFCNDEQNYFETDFRSEPPTQCPNDASSNIDLDSITVVGSIDTTIQEVLIQEETTIKTGGHFQGRGINIHSDSIGWHEIVVDWPHPISLLSAELSIGTEHLNDEFQTILAPDTIIGAVTNFVAANTKVIPVSPTVVENLDVGYAVTLLDTNSGPAVHDLGRCLAIDKTNLTITVENSMPTNLIPDGTNLTYVRMGVYLIRDFILTGIGRKTLGDSKIGGSYIPALTPIKIRYHNKDGLAKDFHLTVEYLY